MIFPRFYAGLNNHHYFNATCKRAATLAKELRRPVQELHSLQDLVKSTSRVSYIFRTRGELHSCPPCCTNFNCRSFCSLQPCSSSSTSLVQLTSWDFSPITIDNPLHTSQQNCAINNPLAQLLFRIVHRASRCLPPLVSQTQHRSSLRLISRN